LSEFHYFGTYRDWSNKVPCTSEKHPSNNCQTNISGNFSKGVVRFESF